MIVEMLSLGAILLLRKKNSRWMGFSNAYNCFTVVPKDYWDKKNLQDMGPLSVNSIHIRGLLFEKNQIF